MWNEFWNCQKILNTFIRFPEYILVEGQKFCIDDIGYFGVRNQEDNAATPRKHVSEAPDGGKVDKFFLQEC